MQTELISKITNEKKDWAWVTSGTSGAMVQVAQLDDTGRGMSENILSVNWDCGKTTTTYVHQYNQPAACIF